MKRILSAILVAISLLIVSCSKDMGSIAGSKWIYVENEHSLTLSFVTESTCVIIMDSQAAQATYTYDKPNVTIYPNTGAGPIRAIINGKQMTLYIDNDSVILTKQ